MEASLIEQKITEHSERLATVSSDQISIKMRIDQLKEMSERDTKSLDNKVAKIGERADEACEKTEELGRDVRDLSHSIRRLEEKIGDLSTSIKDINGRRENNAQKWITSLITIVEAVVIGWLMLKFGLN